MTDVRQTAELLYKSEKGLNSFTVVIYILQGLECKTVLLW